MNEFKWLWNVMGSERYRLIVAFIMSIFASVLTIVNPHVSRLIVDEFVAGPNALTNIVGNRSRLIFLLVFMVIFTLFRTSFLFLTKMAYEKVSKNTTRKIRTDMYEKIQKQDKEYYRKNEVGDLMTRMTGDLDMIRHSLGWVFQSMIESSTIFLVVSIYLATINIKLTLWMLTLAPLIFIVAFMFSKEVRPKYIYLRTRLSRLNSLAQENIAANKIVKSFTSENHEIEKFNLGSTEYKNANQDAALTQMKYRPYLETLAESFTVILLFVGGVLIINGELSYGEFAAFSSLTWAISWPMRNLPMVINDLERFFASASKLEELYFAQSKIVKESYVDNPEKLKGDIEFKDVSFQIGKEKILTDINLKVEAGEFIAIMGPTGSGKSTLLNLIARMQDPTTGEIYVDGKNIKDLMLDEYRANVAVATQEVILFSDTIENNISYGNMWMKNDEIVQVAKDAMAHDFILRTKSQYDTVVGERGIGLSGGQRQRVALARALGSNRSILLLDDTTSAVDNETEQEIISLLISDKYEATKIVVAQRVSTAKHADKILVLKDGRIVEAGTHIELLKEDGFYAESVKILESYELERSDYE